MGNYTTREVEVEEDDRHQTLKTKFVEEQLKQNLKKYELIIKNGKKKLEEKERLLKQQMNKVKSQENSMKLQNEEIQKLRKQLEDAQKEKEEIIKKKDEEIKKKEEEIKQKEEEIKKGKKRKFNEIDDTDTSDNQAVKFLKKSKSTNFEMHN